MRRLPEGVAGISRLHALVADHLDPDAGPEQVLVGIETDRGPWVQALVAAGYMVYAINPLQASRYRERHAASGAKSDPGDAHVLAEIVRLDRDHHRPVAGDSDVAEHVKAAARAHQSMIWSRQRAGEHAAVDAAGVLPGRAGRVRRRPGRRGTRWRCSPPPRHPRQGRRLTQQPGRDAAAQGGPATQHHHDRRARSGLR